MTTRPLAVDAFSDNEKVKEREGDGVERTWPFPGAQLLVLP